MEKIFWLRQEVDNRVLNFRLWRRSGNNLKLLASEDVCSGAGVTEFWRDSVQFHSPSPPPLLTWFATLLEVPVDTSESQAYWTDWIYFLVMDVVESQAYVFSVNTVTVLWINRRTRFTEVVRLYIRRCRSSAMTRLQMWLRAYRLTFHCFNLSSPAEWGSWGC